MKIKKKDQIQAQKIAFHFLMKFIYQNNAA